MDLTKQRQVVAELERLREENAAWMNGVADAIEPLGFDREAACGPADLLPGLADLRAEMRYHYQPEEKAPAGWRACSNSAFSGDDLMVLWTDAPRDEAPHRHNTKWIRSRRTIERRLVGGWWAA